MLQICFAHLWSCLNNFISSSSSLPAELTTLTSDRHSYLEVAHSKMWANRLARVSLPLLQRSTAALSGPVLRAVPRTQAVAGRLRWSLPLVQVCGQHTLQSVSVPSSSVSVKNARALNKDRMVRVDWEDGGHSLYPFTWLRDNCQCPMCRLDSAQARKLLMSEVDVNTGVNSLDVTRDGKVSGWRWGVCVWAPYWV